MASPVLVPNKSWDIPRWLCVFVPFIILIALVVIWNIDSSFYKQYIETESGILENATAFLLWPAALFGLLAIGNRKKLPASWLTLWLAFGVFTCVYYSGEELSWGQQLFHWETPEEFIELNDQQETNLHNMSSWLDQKPRMVLEIGILIGGILLPLLWFAAGITWTNPRDWRYWVFPTKETYMIAFLAIFSKFPERIYDWVYGKEGEWPSYIPFRLSEVQELYFSLFLLTYLYVFYKRVKSV